MELGHKATAPLGRAGQVEHTVLASAHPGRAAELVNGVVRATLDGPACNHRHVSMRIEGGHKRVETKGSIKYMYAWVPRSFVNGVNSKIVERVVYCGIL